MSEPWEDYGGAPWNDYEAPKATWQDRVQAHQAGAWNGLSYLLGSIPDAAANLYNVGKAGIGAASHELLGTDLPQVSDPFPAGRAIAHGINSLELPKSVADAIGWGSDRRIAPTTIDRPDDAASRYIAAASGMLPAAAIGGGSIPGALRSAAAATPTALVGQAVSDAHPFQSDAANNAATALAQVLTSGGGPAVSKATNRVLTGGDAGRAKVAQNRQDFMEATGQYPTAGQALESPTFRAAEQLTGTGWGGRGPMEHKANAIAAGGAANASALVDALGGVRSKGEAGRALQTGIEQFKARTVGTENSTYHGLKQTADAAIPPGTMVNPENSVRVLGAAANPTPSSPALNAINSNGEAARLAAALKQTAAPSNFGLPLNPNEKPTGIPYADFAKTKTTLGSKAFPDNPLLISPDSGELRSGYHAMAQDAQNAVAGTPAAPLLKRADNYYSAAQGRLGNLESLYTKQFPEQAFNQLNSAIKDENLTQLRAVKRSLTPDQFKAQVSTIIDRLGRSNNSNQNADNNAFSFNTLLTNYSQLKPAVRSELFSGYEGAPALEAKIHQMARVAENLREGSKVLANPSGTGPYEAAHNEAAGAAVAMATGHPGMAAAAMSLPVVRAITSRALMTNPKFVDYLAKNPSWLPKSTTAHTSALINALAAQSANQGQ